MSVVVDTHHHFLPPRYVEHVGEDAIAGLLVSAPFRTGVRPSRWPDWNARTASEKMCGVLNELKRLHFDTALSVDPYALPGLLRLVGADQILFGSDYPHAGGAIIDSALESLRSRDLAPETLAAIERENAIGLLAGTRP
jgi:predicted TIM-barrel fold metal-dependent hydrolase